jgi:hypothetical protein
MSIDFETNREMMRHIVASLAYRAMIPLRDAPGSFALYRADAASPSSVEILAHLGDLLDWALRLASGSNDWHSSPPKEWNLEVQRFCDSLQRFDNFLASDVSAHAPLERLFQGPIADAFTHVGQLAMLRRLSGAAMRGENYFVADISIGRVGLEQAAPRKTF